MIFPPDRYCPQCGGTLIHRIPDGDDRPRGICKACGDIFYRNPNMVVGCLVIHEQKILLCRRAIEPRLGLWTLPSGYLENGESAEAGASRETREEAGVLVGELQLHTLYSLPHVNQIYLLFLAKQIGEAGPYGPETDEIRYVLPHEIPWRRLAFRAVGFCLERFERDGMNAGTAPYSNLGEEWTGRKV